MAVPFMDVTVGEKRRKELLQRLLQQAQMEQGGGMSGLGSMGIGKLGIGPGGVLRSAVVGPRAMSPFRARNPFINTTFADNVDPRTAALLGPAGHGMAQAQNRSGGPGMPVPPVQGPPIGAPVQPPVGPPAGLVGGQGQMMGASDPQGMAELAAYLEAVAAANQQTMPQPGPARWGGGPLGMI